MIPETRERLKRQRGQALVEFALSLPIFLMLLFGIVEVGLLLYNAQVITNAGREGARYGIVAQSTGRRTPGEIETVVQAYAQDHLITFGSATTPSVQVQPDPTTGAILGQNLRVEVTFHYDFLVLPAFITEFFGGTDLRTQTTMKYE